MNIDMYPGLESEPGIETYYFEVPIGAAGAPGATVRQRGLAEIGAITRTGAGTYLFTLKDGVQAIVGWSFDLLTTAANAVSTATGQWCRVTGRTQNTLTISVITSGNAPAVADPFNSDTLIGMIQVKNTTA